MNDVIPPLPSTLAQPSHSDPRQPQPQLEDAELTRLLELYSLAPQELANPARVLAAIRTAVENRCDDRVAPRRHQAREAQRHLRIAHLAATLEVLASLFGEDAAPMVRMTSRHLSAAKSKQCGDLLKGFLEPAFGTPLEDFICIRGRILEHITRPRPSLAVRPARFRRG